jgi:HlyD family secretion protein
MRWLRPVAAVAAIALAVWQINLLVATVKGARRGPNTDTALVREGRFVVGITREGTLESANVAQVRAPRSGSVLSWLIDDGAEVKEGDLLAKMDVSEYKFEVDRQRLEYQRRVASVAQEQRRRERDSESAEMNVDKLLRSMGVLTRSQLVETELGEAELGYDRWDYNWASTDYDKQARLLEAGIVPETEVEQSQRKVRSAEYRVGRSEKELDYLGSEHVSKQEQQKADVDVAKFELELAERRIGEAVRSAERQAKMAKEQLEEREQELASGEVRAPQEGIVVLGDTYDPATGRRTLREGDRVRWRMKLADITDLSQVEVALRVEESSGGQLELGQAAVITVVGIPDREFAGEITKIGAVARRVPPWEDPNAATDERVFDVTVRLSDPDAALIRPGMKAKAQFVFEELAEAVYVPLESVFERPEGQVVYVARSRGFDARKVETSKRNDEAVVITKGLKAGERVALSDPTRGEGA